METKNKAFAINPATGESKMLDFDNPDAEMLRQMADVLLNRLNSSVSLLKMLYIDNNLPMISSEIKTIVSDLVDEKITQDEARRKVLAWKAAIKN
jgi:hypothetical protein